MTKYSNRVYHEFEDILLELSKDSSTTYETAVKKANEYVNNFAQKKRISEQERSEIFDICEELVTDWFPDTRY